MITTSNNLQGMNIPSATSQARGATPNAPKSKTGTLQVSTFSALGPATKVDISDQAKSILKNNQSNMTDLERLQSIISTLKNQINNSEQKISSINDVDRSSNSTNPLGMQMLSQVNDYIIKQNTNNDGKISNYNVTINDIYLVPKTKDEIDYWYKNDGADFIAGDFEGSSAADKEMAQAIRDRKIEFIDAKDIPDLNYHNKATFQGGEGGGAPGLTRTYNTQSDIFKDTEKGYLPLADGTVISWKRKTPIP